MSAGKTLILMRHAEAESFSRSGQDSDRQLSPYGEEQIKTQAARLQGKNLIPDYAIISPAQRTLQSWQGMCESWGTTPDHTIIADLYLAEWQLLQQHIATLPQSATTALILAHNPGMAQLAGHLSNHRITDYPTASYSVFAHESWASIAAATDSTPHFSSGEDA